MGLMKRFLVIGVLGWTSIFNVSLAQTIVDSVSNSIDSLIIIEESTSYSIDSTSIYNDSISNPRNDTLEHNAVLDFLFSMDSLDVYNYSFFLDSVNYKHLEYMDTSNHHSGDYSPLKFLNVSYNDLGNIGSAQENQVFTPSESQGFCLGLNNYNAFLWTAENIRLYDTRTPYTEVFYLMGSKKENSLKFSHAQSFMDQQLTMSFDFQLFNRLGAYNNQKTDVKGFMGGMGYRNKNSRYNANFQYFHNKLVLEENGGLVNLSDFEDNKERNRQIIPTNLENAENLIRISGLAFQQSFYLSRPEPDFSSIPDTNTINFEAYSVTHFKKPYFEPVSHWGKISHHFNYERQNYRYTDQDQKSSLYDGLPYYPNPDSSAFFDTIGIQKYQNEFIYSNSDYNDNPNAPKFINFFAGGKHELVNYYQQCQEKEFTHFALIGGVFLNFTKYLSVSSDASYYVGDYLNNDFQFNGKVFIKYQTNLLTGGIKIVHRSPDWMMKEFASSRFTWNNDFNKTDIQKLFVKFERKRLRVEAQLMNVTNLVYLDSMIMPAQSTKNIQHIVIRAQKDIRLGPWGADLSLTYQNVSQANIIRTPEFTGKAKFFYNNIFFNGALELELGIELFYFTKYYANTYMPALRSFYIQNHQAIGEHPFFDAYLNAKIGKARLFLRYDHFNYSFTGYDYYASPSYPAPDGSFKFGVSWILFN